MARAPSEMATGSRASARYIWVSPSKVRQVTALIAGRPVEEARRILAFSPKAAAQQVSKVLESAVANAEHNHQIPQEELFVKSAWADPGPMFGRWRPRARRAAYPIRKRTSHIVVVVERLPEAYVEERLRRTARAKASPRPAAETATASESGSEPAGDEGETKEKAAKRPRSSKRQSQKAAAKPRRKASGSPAGEKKKGE